MKLILPKNANEIISQLERHGFQAYLVGGCVRDILMNRAFSDYDIATDARPCDMKKVFHDAKINCAAEQYGNLTVKAGGFKYEITTYRKESAYSDRRRPDSVLFVESIEEDLQRRDFTMNALACNDKDGLIDLYGGEDDIKNKIIRSVGDPDARFLEDPLRILRAFRFSSQLGFTVEEETLCAMRRCAKFINGIPPVRLKKELNASLSGAYFSYPALCYTFVLSAFIPEINDCVDFNQHTPYHHLDVWGHTVESIMHAPADLNLKLCMLLHDLGKPASFTRDDKGIGHAKGHAALSADMAERILTRLKYDKKTIEHITALILHHDRREKPTYENARAFLYKYGKPFTRELLAIRRADNMAKNPPYSARLLKELDQFERLTKEVIKNNDYITRNEMAIGGDELATLGFSGPEIGKALSTLYGLIAAGQLANGHDALRAYAEEIAPAHK